MAVPQFKRTKFENYPLSVDKKKKRIVRRGKGPPTKSQIRHIIQANPQNFCSNVLGIRLWNKQQQILRTLFNSRNKRLAVPASFGVGKTFSAAAAVLFFLYNFPPAKVVTMAPTWRQVKNLLWRDIRKQHAGAKIPLGGQPITTELSLDEDWYAIGFSSQEGEAAIERITGIHAPHIFVVFDQAAGLDNVYWEGAKAILTSENSYWLALGNTAVYNSTFRKLCENRSIPGFGAWDVLPITAYDSPNVIEGKEVVPGLVTKQWVEDMEELGRDDPLFKIFCLAEFVPETDLMLVPFGSVAPAFDRQVDLIDTLRIGLDIANRGTDYTVWTLWSGTQLLDIEGVTGHLTGPVIRKTQQLKVMWEQQWGRPVEVINGDSNGVGAGVMDLLEEKGEPIFRCIGSSSANEDHRFKNFRAEQGWHVRDLCLENKLGLKLPEGTKMTAWKKRAMENLRTTFENLMYKIDKGSQKILLGDKETLRKALGASPDEFDSVMYGSWEESGGGPGLEVVNTDSRDISQEMWQTINSPASVFDMEDF